MSFSVFQLAPSSDASAAGLVNSVLSFEVSAVNVTGYMTLTMTHFPIPPNASAALSPSNWTGSDWLFVSAVSCPDGWLIAGDICAPCPTGGYCPGGGRVWPVPGWWSRNEASAPARVRFASLVSRSTVSCAVGQRTELD